jgi:pimeloyl-ACP methyl ester carboxylesterase
MRLVRQFATVRGARSLMLEVRGLGTHLLHYPLGVVPTTMRPNGHVSGNGSVHSTPVVLLHGYFHNRSGFDYLSSELRQHGFRWVHGMNYNPLGAPVAELAERFARCVEDVMKVSGEPKVHVVGHSLGGVIVRWFVEQLGGADVVDTCVTIGTPHKGTLAAYLGVGQAARDMRPGSKVVRALERSLRRSRVRYVNLYSDLDILIVPPSAGVLPNRGNVHNHLIEDLGHTSLLLSPVLVTQLARHLEGSEVGAKAARLDETA